MLNQLNPRSLCSFLCNFRLEPKLCVVGLVLLSAAGTAFGFPIVSITNHTLSLGNNGSLSYTVTDEFVNCSGPPASLFQEWVYNKFVFTDQFGVQHALSGTAAFIVAPAGNVCATSGSFPVTLSGTLYTITFTPTANGGATATIHFQPGYVNLRWIVVGVTYAPPGPLSSVQYMGTSLFGTTQTVSKSFTSANSQSISLSAGGILGALQGKVTATVAQNTSMSTTDSKSVTTTFQVQNGEKTGGTPNAFAPVNHDYDIMWVWLNPVAIFSVVDGNAVWNGYGFDAADQPGPDIVPIELGYLNGDFGAMPPDKATSLARSWAAKQIFPSGSGPGITSAELAQIASADPFSVSTYGPASIGVDPPSSTADGRFQLSTCSQSGSINYVQAPPSGSPNVASCTITYSNITTNTMGLTSTYSQMFSIDASLSGSIWFLSLSADLKTSNTLTFTTEQQNSITTTKSSSASLSVQGPPCNNTTPGVGPCIPVYDASGNQPVQFDVYQDNKYGTFMFAPVHYY